MLFARRVLDGIVAGDVTLAFRRWDRPRVRPGGRQRTAAGVVAFESVEPVARSSITAADARRAGHDSLADLLAFLDRRDGRIWRIELRFAGADPRVALREDAELDGAAVDALRARLERLDRAAAGGPWTRQTLELIAAHPETRAADLAASIGREKLPFKRDVRKLKELGLTESLPVGYRLSPRGRELMRRLDS